MDGRRHSVDVPISRALVALRRVRSLRDPSTNSLSKFSPLVENLNWETNSNNAITLGFENKTKEFVNVETGMFDIEDRRLDDERDRHGNGQQLYYSRKSNAELVSHEDSCQDGNKGSAPVRNMHVEGSTIGQPSLEMLCANKSLSERYCSNHRDKGLELACVASSTDCLEGVGSCNEPNEGSIHDEKLYRNRYSKKYQNRKQSRSCRSAAGDVLSRVGSPSLSMSDALLGGSSCGISLNGDEDADALDSRQCGCGIGHCWSRPPRLRESNHHLDAEDQPFLPAGAGEAHTSEWRRGCNHMNNGVTLYSESPRSLSQKFRPKSFSDLVGQNLVARSLLSSISNGRISSFYLFHGPCGTGKTSAARIFAAALNCLSPDTAKPCGHCRECFLFFSGKGSNVKEVDSLKVNKTQRIRAIIKNAENSLSSSPFKVLIIDECHLLREDTWATFLNNLEDISCRVVFIMVTPDLHKLPRSAVSRSQRYHFPKIKQADIASRLGKICLEEGFDFDQDALDYIATKSNGSLRDAEMMLEQLSLIGKKITMTLVYELMGVVSDDELFDLLHLALSSNTPETVKRARELMRSRIDPLHLVSQLANIIMDGLAGKCQEEASEIPRRLFGRSTSEADMQQLSHALKILSETEKQLRMSKNQTTWLTVALLQLSSVGSSLDSNESRLCIKTMQPRDGDFCSTSSTTESLKHLVTCARDSSESCKMGMQGREQTLESVWKTAAGICESSSLKSFLQKRGKLLSINLRQGLAVVELGFYHSKYVSKAEKKWKVIAGALQNALGYNVEIRINLILDSAGKEHAKVKKRYFSFSSCSRRLHHRSQSTTECESNPSEKLDSISTKPLTVDKYVETGSSESGSHNSHACCIGKELVRTIRNTDGNALSIALMTPKHQLGADKYRNCGCQDLFAPEQGKQPGCFPRTLKFQKANASTTSETIFWRTCLENNLASAVPHPVTQTHFCPSDPVVSCCRSVNLNNSCRNHVRLGS
ncbi:protein STICHEL-like 2 [Coffea arabica]|uniref:DNA-directed DNA polymerase n=1 Tax=Coffea arabica TaxID=13443 RepID=A0A6P6XB10_COFAR